MAKIFACDDEEIVLKMIHLALDDLAEVVTSPDGHRALDELRKGDVYDLIITDIHMPYYNGEAIVKFVREEQNRSTPIIMLSSDGEEEVIELAKKEGVTDFIVKPVDAKKIRDKVIRYLVKQN